MEGTYTVVIEGDAITATDVINSWHDERARWTENAIRFANRQQRKVVAAAIILKQPFA